MSKGYAAIKWHENSGRNKRIDVDTWPVLDNPNSGKLTHPAGIVVHLDLGGDKHAQVVFTREDLEDMLTRMARVGA